MPASPVSPAAPSLPPLPLWWPHRAASSFVSSGALQWHVQRWGDPAAPVALLLHGTGAGTHSWRHLAPLLAQRFSVIAPDLPGHAFTQTPVSQSLALPAVATAVAALLDALALRPAVLIGHSAGAAVALELVLGRLVGPAPVAAINGALLPLQGPLGRLMMPLGRLMAANPVIAPAFAACAAWPSVTRRLLDSTGSHIDSLGERCYAHLLRKPHHSAGALRLMAAWDLAPLQAKLAALRTPLLLLAADNDRTLPPEHSLRVADQVPGAKCVRLPRLGHLAHEEDAATVHQALQAGLGWR
jgi:magnesium chelatase accessory protein